METVASALGRDPDFDRGHELAGRGLAYVDAVGRDPFAIFQMEGRPRLGHAAEGHFLNGLARGGVHDGCDYAHETGG